MAELRTCKVCRESKPLTRHNFPGYSSNGKWYLKPTCHSCTGARGMKGRPPSLAERRGIAAGSSLAWLAEQKWIAEQAEACPTIPDSSSLSDLAVVAACWQSCVDEGPRAIKRMLQRIVDCCEQGVSGSAALAAAALACLAGNRELADVRRALEDCVGLAVAS